MKGFRHVGHFMMLLAFIGLGSCASDSNVNEGPFEVVIRVSGEPDNLNPTRSRSSSALAIGAMIFPAMAEYDATTLELTPILVEALAEVSPVTEGPFLGGERYAYNFRQEATWSDGTPVTGEDYAFTLKAVLNPEVNAAAWRSFLSFIVDVELDPGDPKAFTAIVQEPYMLAEVVTCNFNLLPRSVYDPEGLLDNFSVAELHSDSIDLLSPEKRDILKQFAEQFADVKFNRDVVEGAGAYALKEWVTGQYLILERKENWWGEGLEGLPDGLLAVPDQITYRFIPDETAALSALKDGSVDVISGVSANAFVQMRDDPQWADQFQFLTPSLLQYRYLEVNNRSAILSDRDVRRALAYAVDYEAIINNIELGMGERTVGPFPPSKDYYNSKLPLIEQNLDEAREILREDGWLDTDNDGIVDREIDGERQELELEIITTQSPAGQQVALILKESAAQIGIGIEIVTKDVNAWRQAIRNREFDLLPMQTRTSPAPNDPYQNWHSNSDAPGGNNRSGFRNSEVDDVIENIRSAEDASERRPLYLQLQELMYEEQPVIFLYVPLERIIASKRIELKASSRRPGYFENTFKPGQVN